MSNRRMFSNRIANSAKFLQMPAESQLLYFHMILRADDDGVVESYPLMKLLGVAIDSFKVLLAKSFIEQLNEDQVVVINDWQEHNTIRADRKVNSIYLPLLLKIKPDFPIIAPKPRSDVENNQKRLSGPSTDGLSYVKLSKDNIIQENETKVSNTIEEYINANFELKEKYNNVTEEMTNWYINKKTGQGMSYVSILKKFNELQKKEEVITRANHTRAETMSTTNRTAVKILQDLQGIQSLDGKENYKSADSVIKKIKGDMIARHQEVSDNEIDMLVPLQNLLEEIKEKSPFHWKNLTSYNYLDKWFNKIVIEIYGK